jgi:L-arabinose isomerase
MMTELQKVDNIQKELSVQSFLHSKGYTYFTIPYITYKEIKQLIDGDIIIKEAQTKEG